jgi:hypothetical protein
MHEPATAGVPSPVRLRRGSFAVGAGSAPRYGAFWTIHRDQATDREPNRKEIHGAAR